jgi:hypothetical protein
MRAGPGRAAGLGADFAKLWTADAVSNLGDGVTGVAGPLLMAWLTGDPPFPARTTYIPMIGEDLARIRGLGDRRWMALQDRVLVVVHPGTRPGRRLPLLAACSGRRSFHRPRLPDCSPSRAPPA